MTTLHPELASATDRLGTAMARSLTQQLDQLPHPVTERLRAARMRALALHAQARATESAWAQYGATLAYGGGLRNGWLARLGVWGLVLTMVSALVLIDAWQDELRAQELADVDAALLIDELPPAAYADPGFAQFLKSGQRATP